MRVIVALERWTMMVRCHLVLSTWKRNHIKRQYLYLVVYISSTMRCVSILRDMQAYTKP